MARAHIKGHGGSRQLSGMRYCLGAHGLRNVGERIERYQPSCRRFEVEHRERTRVRLILGPQFQQDFVLTDVRVDRRYPPRAIRIIKRVLHLLRIHLECRRFVAIDVYIHLRRSDLHVRRDITQRGKPGQFLFHRFCRCV